jgi:hypothetical protein
MLLLSLDPLDTRNRAPPPPTTSIIRTTQRLRQWILTIFCTSGLEKLFFWYAVVLDLKPMYSCGLKLIALVLYYITQWSWTLLEKPPVMQLLKNFPIFYGTRRFITVFTRALHWSLSSAKSCFILWNYFDSCKPFLLSLIFSLYFWNNWYI